MPQKSYLRQKHDLWQPIILKRTQKIKVQNNKLKLKIFFIIGLLLFGLPTTLLFSESRVDELEQEISQKNKEIYEIEEAIKQYKEEINSTLERKQTLNSEISQLESTANKLKAEVNLAEKKISNTNLTIEQLQINIAEKETKIKATKTSLAEIIRELDEEESQTLLEILLAHNNLSEFFNNLERMDYLQAGIHVNLEDLKNLKEENEIQKENKNKEKKQLERLQETLADKKEITLSNKNQKDLLLKKTQNEESQYRKLLAEQQEKQEALLDEISLLEEEMRVIIDPNSLPPAGSGILKWPLGSITITQEFGWTDFALSKPWLYPKVGHNGVDFRASKGTPLKAAKNGTVIDTGDTDIGCKGASYGQWILIDHENGLSSMYAHLSKIKVAKGDKVETGQLIGYTGDSGATWGPHLHFGVFATQAVKVTQYKSKSCGTYMKLPLVATDGYLDPLLYL
ncbi:MAG: peptidoglycan DD-metalloendopeptidase family protein [Candidatus Marinimicrobia bacterium]|nr:peptidoglycan DD-metalloendopeptidase family protein [Candidatus Neomarinimicrobiota bacterium]